MGYSAGFQPEKVAFYERTAAQQSRYGLDAGGVSWQVVGNFWANVTWKKGAKAMQEGALDAFDTIMVRMDWRDDIDRDCLIQRRGRWYQIESFNDSFLENTIQITARELVNQDVTISNQ